MYGKRKRSTKGKQGRNKRPKGGGGHLGFAPDGQRSAARSDRRGFRPAVSAWFGQVNFPERALVKLRTYATFSQTSTSGAFTTFYVSLNSLNNPFSDVSVTHSNNQLQPLSQLYSRYRVTYARLTISGSPLNATQTPLPMFMALTAWDPNIISPVPTNFTNLIESRLGKAIIVPAINGYTGKPVKVSVGCSPAVVLGRSLVEMKTSDQEGTMNKSGTITDPATLVRFVQGSQSNDGVTTTAVSLDCYLTQYVELYDRAYPA